LLIWVGGAVVLHAFRLLGHGRGTVLREAIPECTYRAMYTWRVAAP
jgi:hypothetical protein